MGGRLWLDDLYAGMAFSGGEYQMLATDVVAFARQFDPQPFHLDPQAAEQSFFGELVASAWHTAAVTMRLMTEVLPIATGIIGASVAFTMPSPTLPGDVLTLTGEVTRVVPSTSRPDRGSVHLHYRTLNQAGAVRQDTEARLVCWKRPTASSSGQ